MNSEVLRRKSSHLVPFIVLGVQAYIDYGSCFVVAWKQVFHHYSAGAAIVFWVLLSVFQALSLFYWAMIFVRGAGTLPSFQQFDLYDTAEEGTSPVPDMFVCEEQGFPIWCSKCQNFKPDRSFHSRDLDVCVPRFDHYCLWIGTAIGRDNFIQFNKFLQYFAAYAIIALVFVAVYTRPVLRDDNSLLPHFVMLLFSTAFVAFFTVALLIVTVQNNFSNSTSFDEITRRQARTYRRWTNRERKGHAWCTGKLPRVERGVRFVNIAHEGTRKVVSYSINEHPYSNGFSANLINMCLRGNYNINSTKEITSWALIMQAIVVAFVPFAELFVATGTRRNASSNFENFSDEFSPSFIRKVEEKIQKGQFQQASYICPSIMICEPKPQ